MGVPNPENKKKEKTEAVLNAAREEEEARLRRDPDDDDDDDHRLERTETGRRLAREIAQWLIQWRPVMDEFDKFIFDDVAEEQRWLARIRSRLESRIDNMTNEGTVDR